MCGRYLHIHHGHRKIDRSCIRTSDPQVPQTSCGNNSGCSVIFNVKQAFKWFIVLLRTKVAFSAEELFSTFDQCPLVNEISSSNTGLASLTVYLYVFLGFLFYLHGCRLVFLTNWHDQRNKSTIFWVRRLYKAKWTKWTNSSFFSHILKLPLATKLHWLDWPASGIHKKCNFISQYVTKPPVYFLKSTFQPSGENEELL